MAYLGCTGIVQPRWNDPKRCLRVIGPCRRPNRMEIEPRRLKIERISDKKQQDVKTTHQICTSIAQPRRNPSKRRYGVRGTRRWCSHMKIKLINVRIRRLNDKTAEEDETTYLGHAHIAQPLGFPSKHSHWVYRPQCQCGRVKSRPTNINWMRISGRTYLGHAHVIRPTWRPKKNKRRISNLTFKSRIPGETWCNDGEYGWSLCELQSAQRPYASVTQLPNPVMTRMSHKWTNLCNNKSQIPFESDTFICNIYCI